MGKVKQQEMAPGKDPILFLDYDGVLHRGGAIASRSTGVIKSELPIYQLFEFEPLLDAVLAQYPDVKIVLSTSWVYQKDGLRESMSRLSPGLRERVIGTVFHDSGLSAEVFHGMRRGDQVLQYVQRHNLVHNRWMALDDRDDGFESFLENLVQPYEFAGIGDPTVLRRLHAKLEFWRWQADAAAAKSS